MKREVLVPPGFTPPPAFLEWEFELKWRMGVRTAMAIVERTKLYRAKIFLTSGGLRLPATSIMTVLLAGGLDDGGGIRLTVRGPEAMAAFLDLTDFFGAGVAQTRCPTEGCDSLPCLVQCHSGGMLYSCAKYHSYHVPRTDEARRN